MENCCADIPSYAKLIEITFLSIKILGGSGKNSEINEKCSELLGLSDEILSIAHLDSSNLTEIDYRLAWARTLLKNYGAIENSARSVWSITSEFSKEERVDGDFINKNCKKPMYQENDLVNTEEVFLLKSGIEIPEEVRPWRKKLYNVLLKMDPFSFEKLSQRLLRECGFDDVKVTKKTGDGGIDGTGKLKINGIFSFNIAFQCKRYQGSVGSSEIRNFRGSLTTDIEKGVFITTGSFSKYALEEACNPGKQQIDLIDGEDFISKLAEFSIGVREIKDYEIDEEFFSKL
ncbi:restriction endonuclease [Amedibacillus sp. YH-ame6]